MGLRALDLHLRGETHRGFAEQSVRDELIRGVRLVPLPEIPPCSAMRRSLSSGSAGFVRCASNPASITHWTSAGCAYPLSAMRRARRDRTAAVLSMMTAVRSLDDKARLGEPGNVLHGERYGASEHREQHSSRPRDAPIEWLMPSFRDINSVLAVARQFKVLSRSPMERHE